MYASNPAALAPSRTHEVVCHTRLDQFDMRALNNDVVSRDR